MIAVAGKADGLLRRFAVGCCFLLGWTCYGQNVSLGELFKFKIGFVPEYVMHSSALTLCDC